MLKTFTLFLFLLSVNIFSMSSKPKEFGSVSGNIIYNGTNFDNILIQLKDIYVFLNWEDNGFYIANVPVGKYNLKINISDSITGNFKKIITNVIVKNFEITKLGNIKITEKDKTKLNPIEYNNNFNKTVIIDDFQINGYNLHEIKKDKSMFFAEDYWMDKLKAIGDDLFKYFKDDTHLKEKRFILIIGHASSNEKNNNKNLIKLLGLNRAKEVCKFMLNNFRIPKSSYIVISKGDSELKDKKNLNNKKNRYVEIKFYSETYFD